MRLHLYSGLRRLGKERMSRTHGQSLGQGERRRHTRFPLVINAEVIAGALQGMASVRNVSSGGIFVKTDMMMLVGADVKLVIDWPATVPGRGSLALVIEGTVLRSNEAGTAIKIRRYECTVSPPQCMTRSLLSDKFARN